jgi:hypothetical protein
MLYVLAHEASIWPDRWRMSTDESGTNARPTVYEQIDFLKDQNEEHGEWQENWLAA